jgi:hypothetical protein
MIAGRKFIRSASIAALVLAAPSANPETIVETIPCPRGRVLVGFTGWQDQWMQGIEGLCARIAADGTIDATDQVSTARAGGTGDLGRASPSTVKCGERRVVTGFAGEKAQHVWDIHAIQCTNFDPVRRVTNGVPIWLPAFPHRNQGSALAQFCLDGRVAVGMTVETGSGSLDHFNLRCQYVSRPVESAG